MWKYTEGPFAYDFNRGRRIESVGPAHWAMPNLSKAFVIYESHDLKYSVMSLSMTTHAGPFDNIEPALVWLKLKGVQDD